MKPSKETLADPQYSAIERAIFELGGWLAMANRLGLTRDGLQRMAFSPIGRATLLALLQRMPRQ